MFFLIVVFGVGFGCFPVLLSLLLLPLWLLVSSRRYARRTWLAAWCAFKRPSGLSGHAHQSKRRNGTTTASLHRRNPYSWPQVTRCSPTAQACPQGTEPCRRLPAEPSEPSTLSVISSAGSGGTSHQQLQQNSLQGSWPQGAGIRPGTTAGVMREAAAITAYVACSAVVRAWEDHKRRPGLNMIQVRGKPQGSCNPPHQ